MWLRKVARRLGYRPIRPVTSNVIFFDTEFTSLDPYKGELLSIGMVKPSGEELYLEIEYEGEMSEWVRENVLPLMKGPKVSREEARRKIIEFVGESKPYLVSYVIEFDAAYLYKLFSVDDEKPNKDLPFHYIILDFASMLFGAGISTERMRASHPDSLLKELGVVRAEERKHHALDDARFLRDVYLKLTV